MMNGMGGGAGFMGGNQVNETIRNLKFKYVELQESHKKEIKRLEEKLDLVKNENQLQSINIATLEKERDELNSQLRNYRDQTTHEKEKTYGELLSTRKKLEVTQSDYNRLDISYKRQSQEKLQIQANLVVSQDECRKFKDQVDEQLQINQNLKNKIEELYKANAQLLTRVEDMESSVLSFDMDSHKAQIRELQAEKIVLQTEIKQAEQLRQQEEHLRLKISQDCADLVKANVTLKNELEDVQRRVRRVSSDPFSWQYFVYDGPKEFEQREDKVKRRQDYIKEAESLRDEVSRLKDDISMGRISIDNKERKIHELTQQCRQTEIALNKALEARTMLDERIMDLEGRIKIQEQELIQLGQDKGLLVDDVAELRNATEIRQSKVQQLMREKQEAQMQLERFQREMSARREFSHLIQELESSGENYLELMRNMRTILMGPSGASSQPVAGGIPPRSPQTLSMMAPNPTGQPPHSYASHGGAGGRSPILNSGGGSPRTGGDGHSGRAAHIAPGVPVSSHRRD
ncbi:hypothetical protein BJ742DRAFT_865963 [Cladochytrium replicatum]|nr:hypothetical protein BJ742DRAFT_865963 [Cladochytrium replicatum]